MIHCIKKVSNISGLANGRKPLPPFREAQFDILYNEGISRLGDLVDTAVEPNVIAKSGSWYSYKDDRIGQGRDAVKKYLLENEKIAKEIEFETRKKLGLVPTNGAAKLEAKSGVPPVAAPKPVQQPVPLGKPEIPKKK